MSASDLARRHGMRYRNTKPAPGERVVHNFPANGRGFGVGGFRYWTEPIAETETPRVRCHCDWTAKVPEHFGTVAIVDEHGQAHYVRDLS